MLKNKKYYVSVIILCIIFLPFMNITKLVNNKIVINGLQLFSTIIIALIIINRRKEIKFDSITIVLFLFCVYQIMISMINNTITVGIIYSTFFLFTSVTFIKNSFEKNDYTIVHALHILLSVIVVVNFPSVVKSISVSEYAKEFLLLSKNSMSMVVISAIFFNYLYSYIYNKKLSIINIILLVIDIISLLIGGGSTSLIIGLLIIAYFVFLKNINIKTKYFFILYIIALVFIFNTKLIENIDFLYDFITNSLNKNITFTGRTYIWDVALNAINGNFWGYGRANSVIFNAVGDVNECHNALLELTLCGGLPSLVLFIIYLYKCLKLKEKNKLNNFSNFIVFVYFIIGLTESIIYHAYLWWILIIIYCINKNSKEDIE